MNESKELKILHEDGNIIIADKPVGLASIAENDTSMPSLHSILEKKYGQKLLIVHRLDKEVSGVIIFAKNAQTHRYLNQQFNGRQVKKYYIALVHGVVKKNGEIKKPIREFGSGRMGIDEQKGKPSSTKYFVIKQLPDYTLLELNPSTGRRHQLRVHLYSIEHPIVGDLKYGNKTVQEKFPRLMLHAKSIGFQLPDGKEMFFESQIPESFQNALEKLEEKGNYYEKID